MNKMIQILLWTALLTNTIASFPPRDDVVRQTIETVQQRSLKGATPSDLCHELDRMDGFTCSCTDSTGNESCNCSDHATTISCTSDRICQGNVCGRFMIDAELQANNELADLKICVSYVAAPAGFLDGCFQVFFVNNVADGCRLQFASDSPFFDTCSDCRICTENGEEGFEIECENIESCASTDGCLVEDVDKIFPGFRSNGLRRTLTTSSVTAFIVALGLGF